MATLQDQTKEGPDRHRTTRPVVGVIVAVVLAGVFLFHWREPVYLGKPAGEWIEELGDNSTAAAQALREMGLAAVAPLIQGLQRKPARWLDAYAFALNHSPRFLKARLAAHYLNLARRQMRIPRVRAAAAQTLGDLGPRAKSEGKRTHLFCLSHATIGTPNPKNRCVPFALPFALCFA